MLSLYFIADKFKQAVIICIGAHAGTNTGHDPPIVNVLEQAVDERPPAAHARFDGMDGTDSIPEDAKIVRTLGQNKTIAGWGAISLFESGTGDAQMIGDEADIFIGQVRAAKAFTAIAALGARKVGLIRRHADCPKRI